ncbi:helix-turn-helix domain-containing protein [Sphingobium sp. PNB]|uniref:S24 family peptidase n=1 Tax=Sphingobium sp. PNB TaxID=863934 RepID=UPI001D0123B5|nr:S24 family peptidase [Sphingobium sp. PNB]MCB4863201.1 helix-turn-helix domain-containing protein [Sphingobium sp. PNB]
MSSRPRIEEIRASIERAMNRKGFTKRSLSSAAGLSESMVRDLLKKTENPGIGTLDAIAVALEMPIEDLIGSERVPLLGEVGAGGLIAYFNDGDQFELVPRPPLAPGRLMALRVKGESMLPKYEPGDIIYVRRDHEGVLPQYLGRHCAVHLTDGGTYLKILSAGTMAGRYTLRSLNAADMENVEVVWASPVLFTMPNQNPQSDAKG